MATQPITVNRKGQVTIPKRIREAMDLKPGSRVVFDVNEAGDVVFRFEAPNLPRPAIDWSKVIGAAPIKLGCTVDEYMEWMRGYADDPR